MFNIFHELEIHIRLFVKESWTDLLKGRVEGMVPIWCTTCNFDEYEGGHCLRSVWSGLQYKLNITAGKFANIEDRVIK